MNTLGQNAGILRDMPWLWAARQRWGEGMRIQVCQLADADGLDTKIPQGGLSGEAHCYVHFAHTSTESVHDIAVKGDPISLLDVLTHIHKQTALSLADVKHLAVNDKGETRVYRMKRGMDFGNLYLLHPEIKK